jgi:flagellar biosynthesis/type III secretory pathway protein FliH
MIIGGILGIEREIERRFHEEMIDIMDNQVLGPAIRKGLEQGRQEGIQQGIQQGLQEGISRALQTVLEGHFGSLPAWAHEKIATASPETKDRWLRTYHRATSLEEALR